MGQLLVRDLDPRLLDALKRRAAANRRSVEAEHRAILEEALAGPPRRTFAEALRAIPDVGEDDDLRRSEDPSD